jgi:hypothetical protein
MLIGPLSRKTIDDVRTEHLGLHRNPDGTPKADQFAVLATIVKFAERGWYYRSCTLPSVRDAARLCGRKLIDDTSKSGGYCAECDKHIAEPGVQYSVSFQVADATGSLWVVAFNTPMEQILGGTTAATLKQYMDDGNERGAKRVFSTAVGTRWLFSLRASMDSSEFRTNPVRVHVLHIQPVSYRVEAQTLLNRLLLL